jgi:hypothetical protein
MQQRLAAGGLLDLLTKDELDTCMGHNFDAAIRDIYRGVDYLSFRGTPNAGPSYTIPYVPESGYCWSVRMISMRTNGNSSLGEAFLGETTTFCVGIVTLTGINSDAVFQFSSNQLVIKDSQPLTLFSPASLILAYQVWVKQVPIEMQGKL